ncbi:alpha/beta fold hydrolase [Coralloluteibacterium stylophorae]|uniref:Alpha/beta hydrolase n=1 Tax=Coralloluteibacterium stylophorae TaxID=1776034 RepID=A0A8J7VVG3_9GAMM|nr:alpha/beta hydrolase [Coralloluteibacterium stylophorae]MBS7458641.1 alpha/beta hydrolase [Coralloluteibacterium stylophorae]
MILRTILCLFLAMALGPALAAGQVPPRATLCASPAAGLPEAAERFEVGRLAVQRFGAHGRPLVLVPGLASGAWAWAGVAAPLAAEHRVYVVTLPGFDARAGVEGEPFHGAAQALQALLARLPQDGGGPVLVGHSLGGALALQVAAMHPEDVAGVVAIDGLPVFPGMERLDAPTRIAAAERLHAQMAAAGEESFLVQQQAYMRGIGFVDTGLADRCAVLAARSDATAVADAARALMRLDLRPAMARADVPVLEIVPYLAGDHAAPPRVLSAQQKADYYRGLLGPLLQAGVVVVEDARHFVQLERPQAVLDAIDGFVARLDADGAR